MADKSSIEWTDATWNPIVGCTILTPGCKNCYAMRLARRLALMSSASHYAGTTEVVKGRAVWSGKLVLAPTGILTQPIRWKRARMIFVNSMGDVFHEDAPSAWIETVYAVMALAPQHIFQMLTKRAERMQQWASYEHTPARVTFAMFTIAKSMGIDLKKTRPELFDEQGNATVPVQWPLPNVWTGVSTERQQEADERIPLLLDTPAAVRFISAEPLLGPIDLTRLCILPQKPGSIRAGIHLNALAGRYCESGMPYLGAWDVNGPCPPDSEQRRLDWVIVGGESGPKARPSNPQWFRDLRDQCAEAGTPHLHKQNGAWVSVSEVEGNGKHFSFPDGRTVRRVGKKKAGRTLDGIEHNGFPRKAA